MKCFDMLKFLLRSGKELWTRCRKVPSRISGTIFFNILRMKNISNIICTAEWGRYFMHSTSISGGKQWQTTPKNLPRMQCARATPVT